MSNREIRYEAITDEGYAIYIGKVHVGRLFRRHEFRTYLGKERKFQFWSVNINDRHPRRTDNLPEAVRLARAIITTGVLKDG